MGSWLLIITVFGTAQAQSIRPDLFKNYKPRNIGPAGMSGRITAIDAVIANPDIIYIGAASGGVWKTENGTQSWTPVFNDQPLQNIGSIAIQQGNPSIVWVGTGEGNPRNSLNLGAGIFKSMDAGRSWKRMGLEKTICLHRILIDPENPNTVYAAAIGNPYGEHPDRGVFKTIDGGETWSKILYVNDTTGCADLVMDPSNPNKLIAAMWQFRRKPWELKSGGPGSGLYITIDGGKNWKKLGKEDGMPEGELGRIGIAFARSKPSRVYAKIESSKNGFYKSDDGGFTWQLVNNIPAQITDRPFYYQEIYVDPTNENRIYDIHSSLTYSEDGGKSFLPISQGATRTIHGDHHAWWINPNDPDFIIEGSDGGLGISRDRGRTWVSDEKIPAGQFYHVNVDNELPYHVMGGMQDNGSWQGPAYSWIRGGIRNYYWNFALGGDGFDVMADPEDANWLYAMSQGGNLSKTNLVTGERSWIKPPSVDPKVLLRFNWNAAIAQDPFDKKTIYYGSQFLHKSTDKGSGWQIISPDLTTNDSVKIRGLLNTGGLTLDITGAETYCTIISIAPSPKEQGMIWVGTDDGKVQLTRDGGKTWNALQQNIPGFPQGGWIPQITASRYNAGEAFVVVNDYRRGDFKPYVFRTTDFGKTWTRMIDENKVKGYALCMIQDPVEPNLVFAGTENGLWVSFDNGVSFRQWTNGYPSVSTYDLAIQEREADLVIATFGRSLWILDDIRPLRKIATNKGAPLTKTITAFEIPEAYQAFMRFPTGYNVNVYEAENRSAGARVSFFINKPKMSDTAVVKSSSRGDTATVKIYDPTNKLIRTLRWGVDSGFNRKNWGLEAKGYREPGAPKAKPGDPEPGGLPVLPGIYKLVIHFANASDSAFVNVKDDPRTGNRNELRLALQSQMERLVKSSDKLNMGLDRLEEAGEVCTKILAQAKGLEGKDIDSLKKASTKIQEEIKAIREKISGKISEKQGISRTANYTLPNTIEQLELAFGVTGSKISFPGKQEETLIVNAETAVADMIREINAFFDSKWAAYRKLAEATPLHLFKDYKPIE